MPVDRDRLLDIVSRCRVAANQKVRLTDFDPGWAGDPELPKSERKKLAESVLSEDVAELAAAQELLYAADSWAVLVIFQAMDAAGKDSTIKHVMSGVNPQGCQVYSFKHPSAEELDHDFLWRCAKALPERGRIGIFNRSYYEEVLIVRVHPELVESQRIPNVMPGEKLWRERFETINGFERHLAQNGTKIVKFFLNVSKDEQRKRFLARIEDPRKHWKFSPKDVGEREYWDDYMAAYEDMLSHTSSEQAPWYIVPADHKWVTRAIVASALCEEIRGLDLRYPEVTDEQRAAIDAMKSRLEKK